MDAKVFYRKEWMSLRKRKEEIIWLSQNGVVNQGSCVLNSLVMHRSFHGGRRYVKIKVHFTRVNCTWFSFLGTQLMCLDPCMRFFFLKGSEKKGNC
jgi:ribulose-5-phosphate 4-epimerase/fuculose-1-phosphate aldolase